MHAWGTPCAYPHHCAYLPVQQISSSRQPVVRTYRHAICALFDMPTPSSHLRARLHCMPTSQASRSFRRRPPSMFRYIAFLGLHCSVGIRALRESHDMMGPISPPTDITFIEHMGGHFELGWTGGRSTAVPNSAVQKKTIYGIILHSYTRHRLTHSKEDFLL